jgi:hypothetical protein
MEEITAGLAMEAHTQLEVVAVVVLTGGVVRYIAPVADLPVSHHLESTSGTVAKLNSHYTNPTFTKHMWSLLLHMTKPF